MFLDKLVKSTAERLAKIKSEFEFPFEKALRTSELSFICEVKKASPSKGIIAADFPYLEIALEYEAAGAAAVSVLTEPEFFLGSDQYLKEISQKIKIPTLRKDFIIDPYQIYEAKILGASAILLISEILDEKTLAKYIELSDSLGLSTLVESHSLSALKKALAAGARIIGVNNRNLDNFEVDINNTIKLREHVPSDKIFVSESGINNVEDIKLLKEHNVNTVLIGEILMRSLDKKAKLNELRGNL